MAKAFDHLAAHRAPDRSPLGWAARLCWHQLVNHAGPDGLAWPSRDRIAALAGISRSSVIRGMAELERGKWVAKWVGTGRHNRYQLRDQCPTGTPPEPVPDSPPRSSAPQAPTSAPQAPQVVPDRHPNDPVNDPVNDPGGAPGGPVPHRHPPKEPKKARGRTQVPKDLEVEQTAVELAQAYGFSEEEIGDLREEFIDFWQGNGGLKRDWQATLRGRIRTVASQQQRKKLSKTKLAAVRSHQAREAAARAGSDAQQRDVAGVLPLFAPKGGQSGK